MAERVGFEPTRAFTLAVFKTAAFNRSATSPRIDRGAGSLSRSRLIQQLFGVASLYGEDPQSSDIFGRSGSNPITLGAVRSVRPAPCVPVGG
jgi:hypothetical protein